MRLNADSLKQSIYGAALHGSAREKARNMLEPVAECLSRWGVPTPQSCVPFHCNQFLHVGNLTVSDRIRGAIDNRKKTLSVERARRSDPVPTDFKLVE
jgi:hypothetical protein